MNKSIHKKLIFAGAVCAVSFYAVTAYAALKETDQRLARCLHRAEEMPDHAKAETESWIKKGGGDPARLCHAFAQFHRGAYSAAAQEFSSLAGKRDGRNTQQAAALHAQAGLAAMRAGDHKLAEAEYKAALKNEPQDPDIWVDRATERAAADRTWEALDDINKALELMPDMPEALRLRGQLRLKLGQDNSAKNDFERAGMIDGAEAESTPKP